MFWKAKVKLYQQSYNKYKLSMWYFRMIGLFPYTLSKIKSNIYLQLSPLYVGCGWVFASISIFAAYHGILLDGRSKNKSIKIAFDTDELMLLIQVTGYSMVIFSGTFINAFMFRKLLGYVTNINQADLVLKTKYSKSDTYKLTLVLAYTLFSNSSVIWYYLNNCYKILGTSVGMLGVLERYTGLNAVAAVSYTSEFTNIIILSGLEKRIERLNQLLNRLYVGLQNPCWVDGKKCVTKTDLVSWCGQNRFDEDKSLTKLIKGFQSIMDAANQLNDLLGAFALVSIIAVFWSLVQCPYFFILALTGKRGQARSRVELLETFVDFCFHVSRALLIIEPPYSCLVQMERTKSLVCKLSTCDLSRQVRRQVKTLAVMLELRKLQFAPFGFFVVNRSLFTSLLDAIMTLLVVLLQHRDHFEINW